VKHFEKVFHDKTKNQWQQRQDFEAVEGKYSMINIDCEDDEEEEAEMHLGGQAPQEHDESQLVTEVQELMELICNKNLLKQTLIDMDIDIEKFPLGKLSKAQVDIGYKILCDLAELIIGDKADRESQLVMLSNKFYTSIPHNFGMQLPPTINSLELLKQKIEMLEALGGIEASRDLLQNTQELLSLHPLDRSYRALRTALVPISAEQEEAAMIEKLVSGTHGATHTNYKLTVKQIFQVSREGEARRFAPFTKLHNRRLLWHGSRMSNVAGILSQGLRIAPPEAPSTGYMFGKGLYFADCVSKSANYCRASQQHPDGILLLCEVACGQMHPLKEAQFMERAPHGCHSVLGVGQSGPHVDNQATLEDDVIVAHGPIEAAEDTQDSSLLYNEFIVYDQNQVHVAFAVRVSFDFY